MNRLALSCDRLAEILETKGEAISYEISRILASEHPDSTILEGSEYSFDIVAFAGSGACWCEIDEHFHAQFSTDFDSNGKARSSPANAAYRVSFKGREFLVLYSTFAGGSCSQRRYWLLGPDPDSTRDLFETTCRWNESIHDEILVYHGGCWIKDPGLFESIRSSRFDNLILPSRLVDEIRLDFRRFLDSRDFYERHGVPWRRGAILVGPPGNGKTHTIKALINEFGLPTIYVKTIVTQHSTDQSCLQEIFERARAIAPCFLVLEDLDSMIVDENRSFFLNEMDGFAQNSGLITIASTNHLDRLDPAIVSRPSRFDRKYHFPLPGFEERRRYLLMWGARLEGGMNLDDEAVDLIAAATEGFTFAYLKELLISAMLRWVEDRRPGAFREAVEVSLPWLREQMVTKDGN
ncbi:MAG: ATP-binding protein [Isosphaeraceae bacterium]|nr:ATP-binding protein [Isosphaeraceae bacterium]